MYWSVSGDSGVVRASAYFFVPYQDPYNQLPMPPPRTLPTSIQDTCKPIPRLILRTAHLQLPLKKQVGGNFGPEMGGKIQAAIEIGADTAWL